MTKFKTFKTSSVQVCA